MGLLEAKVTLKKSKDDHKFYAFSVQNNALAMGSRSLTL